MNSQAQPLISVGIPLFNGEATIGLVLQALLNQTYKQIQIIVSDDQSSDGGFQICKSVSRQDDRIELFSHTKNLGAAANFNFTLSKARGDFFAWNAQEDLREPEYFEECMKLFSQSSKIIYVHSLYSDSVEPAQCLDLRDKSVTIRSIEPLIKITTVCRRFLAAYASGMLFYDDPTGMSITYG